MKKRRLQVSLQVTRPSVVELTVGDKVQLDRLSPSPSSPSPCFLAERHGGLIGPGLTTLHLEQGFYYFKTLTEAHLKVISGGISASITGDDPKDPWPPPSATPRGDEPAGEAPALVVEHVQETP
jgi:hypothetical protein